MSKIDDGGPAFPLSADAAINPVTNVYGADISSGLTKRDYFAAKAMAAMLGRNDASPSDLHEGFQTLLDFIARASYQAADALIAASKSEVDHG